LLGGAKKVNGPKVSIVITTYNRPRFLERAIRSVLEQSYRNFDLHVVDDGSSDETLSVIGSMLANHGKMHHWRHDERKGLAATRNTGVAHSSGKYIAFLDDDDEWKPECLEKRIGLLMKLDPTKCKKLGVIYCGCEVHIVPENRITYNLPKIQGDIRDSICTRGLSTIPSSCLFPRDILERIGGFDESLASSIDHDIWMSLASHGYHAYAVKEPLVVTYHTKKRKSAVTDTSARIQGVEQYLAKWTQTYEDWFGTQGAQRYIQRYRRNVLGGLAGQKLSDGAIGQAWRLIQHIVLRNGRSPASSVLLAGLVGRYLARRCVPGKMIDWVKGTRSQNWS